MAVVQGEPIPGKQVHVMPFVSSCTHRTSALPNDYVRRASCTRILLVIWHVC